MGLEYLVIDRNSQEPLYQQIRDCFLEEIRSGRLAPGDQLPTEEEVCRCTGISRPVIRQAYQELEAKGLIQRKRRKGGVVCKTDNRGLFMYKMESFQEEMEHLCKVPDTRLVRFHKADYNEELFNELNLEETDICLHIERMRYADGKAFVHIDNYVPLKLFPGLENYNFEKESLYHTFKRHYQVFPSRSLRSIWAKQAGERIGKEFGIPADEAMLVVSNVVYDQNDRVIEVSVETLPGDSHKFEFTVYADN